MHRSEEAPPEVAPAGDHRREGCWGADEVVGQPWFARWAPEPGARTIISARAAETRQAAGRALRLTEGVPSDEVEHK